LLLHLSEAFGLYILNFLTDFIAFSSFKKKKKEKKKAPA